MSQTNLDLADSIFANGDYKKSLELYQQIIKSEPSNILAHSGLALSYGKLGDFKSAFTSWKNCLKIDSLSSRVYFNLALLHHYEIKSKEDYALLYYNKSLSLDSTNYFTLYYLGKYHSENGNNTLAEKLFLKSLNYCCEEFKGYVFFELGVNYYNRKLYKRAIEYLTKSIALRPEDSETYNYRGLCYNGLFEFDKCDADWKLEKKYRKAERAKKDQYIDLPCHQN